MWMQKETVCDSSPGPTSTAALGLFISECPQGVASLLWASGWSPLAGSAGTALGGNSDAALVGLKRLLERPALLHPTLMPSQICRLIWREKLPLCLGEEAKLLRAMDLTGCVECVVKNLTVAPDSVLFLSHHNLLAGLTLLNILALL